MTQQQMGLERALEHLERRLSEWRESHGAPTRIPQKIWGRAAELAAQLGLGRVAKTLRLDYSTLKRRAGDQSVMVARAATFVEVVTPAASQQCILKVRSPRGSQLRLEWSNPAPGAIAAILREFSE